MCLRLCIYEYVNYVIFKSLLLSVAYNYVFIVHTSTEYVYTIMYHAIAKLVCSYMVRETVVNILKSQPQNNVKSLS